MINNLRGMFINIASQTAAAEIKKVDIIGKMKADTRAQMKQHQDFLDKTTEIQERQQMVLDAIKSRLVVSDKDAPNFMLQALEETIAAFPAQITGAKEQIEIHKEMLTMLGGYIYVFDEIKPSQEEIMQRQGVIFHSFKLGASRDNMSRSRFFTKLPKPRPISWWRKLIIKPFGKRYVGSDVATEYSIVVVSYYYKGKYYIFESN